MRCSIAVAGGVLVCLLATGCGNRPPNTPDPPSGVLSGYTHDTFAFTATSDDPDGDAVSYRFDWGNGDTSGWSAWTLSGDAEGCEYRWREWGTWPVSAQARDMNSALSGWSLTTEVRIGRIPPAPLCIGGPSVGYAESTYTFTVPLERAPGETLGLHVDWGDGRLDTIAPTADVDTFLLHHSWRPSSAGTLDIRARAITKHQVTSDWSSPHRFGLRASHPPAKPSAPSGPPTGHGGSVLRFSTSTTDPDGDDLVYRFEWGNGDTSRWSSLTIPGESLYTLGYTWQAKGIFELRAQAADEHGVESEWSDASAVTLDRVGTWQWTYDTEEAISSAPALGPDQEVYIGSRDNFLYSFNSVGHRRWRFETAGNVESSPAVADDGTVYFSANRDSIFAVNPDGSAAWRYRQYGRIPAACPAIGSDGVTYWGMSNHLAAIGPDGDLRWQYITGARVWSSPAIGTDGTIYFAHADGVVYALNPDSTLRWECDLGSDVNSSPALGADGTVYIGCTDGKLHAVSPGGTPRWHYQTEAAIDREHSPAVGPDGTVYIGSFDGYLHAVNPDGTGKWRFAVVDGPTTCPAIAADGTVYIGGGGILYALDSTGVEQWRFVTDDDDFESSPAIGPDGMVYFGDGDGYVYAVHGTAPLADAPWPMFHHDPQHTGRAAP